MQFPKAVRNYGFSRKYFGIVVYPHYWCLPSYYHLLPIDRDWDSSCAKGFFLYRWVFQPPVCYASQTGFLRGPPGSSLLTLIVIVIHASLFFPLCLLSSSSVPSPATLFTVSRLSTTRHNVVALRLNQFLHTATCTALEGIKSCIEISIFQTRVEWETTR